MDALPSTITVPSVDTQTMIEETQPSYEPAPSQCMPCGEISSVTLFKGIKREEDSEHYSSLYGRVISPGDEARSKRQRKFDATVDGYEYEYGNNMVVDDHSVPSVAFVKCINRRGKTNRQYNQGRGAGSVSVDGEGRSTSTDPHDASGTGQR